MDEIDVRVLKLVNGETLISAVVDEGEGHIELLHPLLLHNQTEQNMMGTFLSEWIPISGDDLYQIPYYSVIVVSAARDEVADMYRKVVDNIKGQQDEMDELQHVDVDKIQDVYQKQALKNFRGSANTVIH